MNKLVKYNPQTDLIESSWNQLAKNSQAGYKSDLAIFYDFVKKDLVDVTAADIIAYRDFLVEKRYKNTTINRKLASLSKVCNVYHISGAIKVNPHELAKQTGKLHFKAIKAPFVLPTMQNIKDCIAAKDVRLTDMHCKIMIKFLVKTAVRVSEMINIELRDITEINSTHVQIKVVGKGGVERYIPVKKSFIKQIRKIFNHDTLLFCSVHNEKYNRRFVYQLIKDRFRRVCDIKSKPHAMRHFFATYKLVVEKKDLKAVSRFLGHSSTAITSDTYQHAEMSIKDVEMDV